MKPPSTQVGKIVNLISTGRLEELTEDQKQYLNKVSIADDLIRLYGAGKKARLLIAEKLDCQVSTATKWMREAQLLYGSTSQFEKKYWKSFAAEEIVKTLNAMRNAMYIKDEEGNLTEEINTSLHPSFFASYQKLWKEFRETIGYDQDDDLPTDVPIPDVIVLTGNPKDIGIEPTGLSRDEIYRKWGQVQSNSKPNE